MLYLYKDYKHYILIWQQASQTRYIICAKRSPLEGIHRCRQCKCKCKITDKTSEEQAKSGIALSYDDLSGDNKEFLESHKEKIINILTKDNTEEEKVIDLLELIG